VLVMIRVRKRQVGRSPHRWEHSIKMDLKEHSLERVINDLAQNRDKWLALVNAVKTFRHRITCGVMGIS